MKDLPVAEMARRYERGESASALGRVYGVGCATVLRRLRAAGVKTRTRAEAREGQRGQPRKRGGPFYVGVGYLRTQDRGHENQDVHRGCWEAHNGPIPEGHFIHHINGNRLDNAIRNLACMTASEHTALHNRGRAAKPECKTVLSK
uniref:Putative homing endonuclease n=1 Tax=viral metagenome TaxID=1070528 RepID=A0A6M3K798_9ZZZZ